MFKKILFTFVAIAALVSAERVSATVIIDVSTDNSGKDNHVNVDNSLVWNFGITDLGANKIDLTAIQVAATVDAKDHTDSKNFPLVFSLYSGLGGNVAGNTLLTSGSFTGIDNQYSLVTGTGKNEATLGTGFSPS